MSNLSRRVANLEAKFGGDIPYIWVFPAAPIPEHDFSSNETFFRTLAAKRIGHPTFKLGVFPARAERNEDVFHLVTDMKALLGFVSKYTDRVGMPPNPLRPRREELEACITVLEAKT